MVLEGKYIVRKLDDHTELFILGLIVDNPSLYLSEVCDRVVDLGGVQVSQATICRLLKRYGLTRKNVRQVALQRSHSLRGAFIAQVLMYKRDIFVWVDETGCDTQNSIRKFGYSIRREHQYAIESLSEVSAIVGLVGLDLKTSGTIDLNFFYNFLGGSWIPQMNPFDGSSPESIVVMDNCSVHHLSKVKQLFDAIGIPMFFLLPYSPDYNPIEQAFSYV